MENIGKCKYFHRMIYKACDFPAFARACFEIWENAMQVADTPIDNTRRMALRKHCLNHAKLTRSPVGNHPSCHTLTHRSSAAV